MNALLCLLPALLLAAPAKEKVLVLPLTAGEGVTEGTAKAITDALLGEVRKRPVQVLGSDDVRAMLSVERQRQLLGCGESSCVAELGGALGADRIVNGSVARLGQSWLIHVQLIDARKAQVLAQSDRRKKGGSVDDVLDELPAMAGELFGATAPRPPVAAAPVPAPEPAASVPAPIKDLPLQLEPGVREKLAVATDGAGHYLAFVPLQYDGPLLAGGASALYAQRIVGGGRSGDEAFDTVFWEPRVQRGAESELNFAKGQYVLTCGKHEVPYKRLEKKDAEAFLAKAKLFDVRWQRQLLALGRDDDGLYYLVDGPRSDDEPGTDVHLFVGKKGHLQPVAVSDVTRANGQLIVQAEGAALKLPLGEGDKLPAGSWGNSTASKPVTALDLWSNKGMAYSTLGAYGGAPLGTACDPYLGAGR